MKFIHFAKLKKDEGDKNTFEVFLNAFLVLTILFNQRTRRIEDVQCTKISAYMFVTDFSFKNQTKIFP